MFLDPPSASICQPQAEALEFLLWADALLLDLSFTSGFVADGLKTTLSELDDLLLKAMGIFIFTPASDEPLDETLDESLSDFARHPSPLFYLLAYCCAVSIVFWRSSAICLKTSFLILSFSKASGLKRVSTPLSWN